MRQVRSADFLSMAQIALVYGGQEEQCTIYLRFEGSYLFMNKSELVKAIAEAAEVSNDKAGKMLNAFVETVEEALAADDKVVIPGFGSFEARKRGERQAMNLRTGEKITVPAGRVPAFKAGKSLKEKIK